MNTFETKIFGNLEKFMSKSHVKIGEVPTEGLDRITMIPL